MFRVWCKLDRQSGGALALAVGSGPRTQNGSGNRICFEGMYVLASMNLASEACDPSQKHIPVTDLSEPFWEKFYFIFLNFFGQSQRYCEPDSFLKQGKVFGHVYESIRADRGTASRGEPYSHCYLSARAGGQRGGPFQHRACPALASCQSKCSLAPALRLPSWPCACRTKTTFPGVMCFSITSFAFLVGGASMCCGISWYGHHVIRPLRLLPQSPLRPSLPLSLSFLPLKSPPLSPASLPSPSLSLPPSSLLLLSSTAPFPLFLPSP